MVVPLPPEPPGPLAPPGHGAADPVAALPPPLKPAPAEPLSAPAEPRLASSPAPGVIRLAPTSQPHIAAGPTPPGPDGATGQIYTAGTRATPAYPAPGPTPPGPDGATGQIYTAGTRATPAYPAQPAGPAEGVIRTGRAGPVGWRPPASPPPGAAAMMSVPHPEVVRYRPAPGDDRLVPVLVERPEKRGAWQPLWLIGVIVAGILVAAGAVAATLPRGDDAAIPGPASSVPISSAPPPSASASPTSAAPENLKIKDNRDSVSLTWSYPEDAEGPVLISGGRAGQEQRAFQQLPAGTTDYVVYGLNNAQDYCFAVAVVYDTDRVAASKPVCTNRK